MLDESGDRILFVPPGCRYAMDFAVSCAVVCDSLLADLIVLRTV